MGADKLIGYRTDDVVVVNRVTNKEYLPPSVVVYDIFNLVSKLLGVCRSILDSLEKAAGLYWGFVKIHPFKDGNGRTARILFLYVLYSEDYNDDRCKLLERSFEKNGEMYEKYLDDDNPHYQAFCGINSLWLDCFLNSLKN